jgi:hypothetical protein
MLTAICYKRCFSLLRFLNLKDWAATGAGHVGWHKV